MMIEGTYSLTFCWKGLNWRLYLPTILESQHTHNFAFSPWTTENPCSPRTDGSPHAYHTYQYDSVQILVASLSMLLLLLYFSDMGLPREDIVLV